MKRSVLAPVDLDRKAEDIMRCAARLARLSQAKLVVVHVVDDYSAESGYAPFTRPREVREAMARAAHAWLVGLLHHLGIQGADIVVTQGGLWEAIVSLAEDRRAGYVVTGQSKWGLLGKLSGLHDEPRIAALDCDVIGADARTHLTREGILLG
jgi:nucleotide-binding universal stress UspA family protein